MDRAYELFQDILTGSMEYTIQDNILVLTGYYSGKSVSIDLTAIDEEMFETICVDSDEM